MTARSRLFPRSRLSGQGFAVLLFLATAVTSVAQPPSKYSNKLAPYVNSPQRVVDRMLELASIKPGETVFDLGCGDGRVLITAAQRFNARAVGIEISEKLAQRTSSRIAGLGLQDQVKVIRGDLREADLSSADVVVIYLLTGSNKEIRPQLEKQLRAGSRVVSYSYAVPGWKASRVDRTDEHEGHLIYVYEMPPTPAN
jgi:protein-L-isoaspartate O-methyltransferase